MIEGLEETFAVGAVALRSLSVPGEREREIFMDAQKRDRG
jgi:hypothetical protein